MNDLENAVEAHYADNALLARIFGALDASGIEQEALKPEHLTAVEEFHIGGRKATEHLVTKLEISPDQHVLDVGCGIGGAARYVADQRGAKVTGIDLTADYISTAKALTMQFGLHNLIDFEVASALAMPFENAAFDAAMTLHVAMNIEGRVSLYREIARVLKPGAVLGVYDVMTKRRSGLTFPLPWAETASTSHLTTPEVTFDLLEDAGFAVYAIEDRTEFAIQFFKETLAAQANGPAPLGIHLLMGNSARDKLGNVFTGIKSGVIAPVQMLAKLKEHH